ncbi:MAG: sulfite exporter TauE/SafE family protein [Alphaproteobacteria bacterium]|nr:MAG: sulfite exporter TauE/SafE family protein [Alphaproteobacteria bacterium]
MVPPVFLLQGAVMDLLIELWWLVPTVFFTAIITAVTGAGGGVLLLGLMGLVLPGPAVIPVHGAVMSMQNAFRGVLLFDKVDWRFVGIAVCGSVVGAFLAGPVAVSLPEAWMQGILGVGILYLVWAPKPKNPIVIPGLKPDMMVAVMAMAVSVLTMLIGAAGVLFNAIRRRGGRAKEGVLADQSWLMLCQHILKVIVFGIAGFAFGPYLPLIGCMMLMGLIGTFVGVKLMKKMSNDAFDKVFKGMVTLLAFGMLWKALT